MNTNHNNSKWNQTTLFHDLWNILNKSLRWRQLLQHWIKRRVSHQCDCVYGLESTAPDQGSQRDYSGHIVTALSLCDWNQCCRSHNRLRPVCARPGVFSAMKRSTTLSICCTFCASETVSGLGKVIAIDSLQDILAITELQISLRELVNRSRDRQRNNDWRERKKIERLLYCQSWPWEMPQWTLPWTRCFLGCFLFPFN